MTIYRMVAIAATITFFMGGALYGQMMIKNSFETPVLIATQDGRVGIGLTQPDQIMSTLHVSGAKYYETFWGIPSYSGAYIATNNEGQGNIVERGLVVSVPYDPTLSTGMWRKALTSVVWDNTPNSNQYAVSGSMAADIYADNHRIYRAVEGIVNNVFDFDAVPAPAGGVRTVAGAFFNHRSGSEDFNLRVNGTSKSYFESTVGIGTTNPVGMMNVSGAKLSSGYRSGSYIGQLIKTNGEAGMLTERALVVAVPYATSLDLTRMHKAITADLYDGNNEKPINGSLAIVSNSAELGFYVYEGVQGYVVRDYTFPTTSRTIAGNFINDRNGDNDFVLHVKGTKSWFTGRVGIGTSNPGYLLQVGEAGDGSEARANAWNMISDIKYKTDIKKIERPLETVQKLSGVSFTWKSSKKKSLGFIAQDVEKVLPETISKGLDGDLAINYDTISAVLVEALKEQQSQIEDLKREIGELRNK